MIRFLERKSNTLLDHDVKDRMIDRVYEALVKQLLKAIRQLEVSKVYEGDEIKIGTRLVIKT
jgi:hypothetical protein